MDSSRPFRAEDWWVGKASLLVGLVYLFSICFSIPFDAFWWYSLWSILTIIGFASFGYLVNDYFDQEKDALVGKKNYLLGKPTSLKIAYCLIALLLLSAPWFFLPHDRITYLLIFLQLVSYFIYSIPPLRFKERGIPGLVVDTLYAHAIPTLLAAYTYTLIAGQKPQIIFFGLLFCWQSCVGIRNVLLHQQNDLASDKKSNTNTFLRANKNMATAKSLAYIKVVELLFLTSLLVFLSSHNILFSVSLVALTIGAINNLLLDKKNGYRYYFPNVLYDQWLPYSYIVILAIIDIRFLLLLPLQAILFTSIFVRDQYKKIPFQDYRDHLKHLFLFLFIKFKLLANWMIYLVFRLAGIDLIKEKTDARGYFLRKVNKQK